MNTSKGINNAQAIVSMLITLLPWILRMFGVDVPDVEGTGAHSSEFVISALGASGLATAEPVQKA